MSDTASVEYDLYYTGDPKDGEATVNLSTGEITFTETSTSL